MHILDYLEQRPESPETELMWYLHNFFTTYPGIQATIHFNTPFYTANRWLIYNSLQKKGGIEVCFVMANRFENALELLDFKKRKQVAGIYYQTVADIDELQLDRLVQEALRVDGLLIPAAKKRKTSRNK